MLKFVVLFSIILYSISCRAVVEKDDSSKQECRKKFNGCLEQFMNKLRDVQKVIDSSTTITPLEFDIRKESKNMLKCIGIVECKGPVKMTKFILDTTDFYTDRVWEANDCLEKTNSSHSLYNCINPKDFDFEVNKNFSQSVVPCTKEVIEKTECSIDIKVNLERGAYAVKDMYAQLEIASNDEEYKNNFDLVFDPRKYGF